MHKTISYPNLTLLSLHRQHFTIIFKEETETNKEDIGYCTAVQDMRYYYSATVCSQQALTGVTVTLWQACVTSSESEVAESKVCLKVFFLSQRIYFIRSVTAPHDSKHLLSDRT